MKEEEKPRLDTLESPDEPNFDHLLENEPVPAPGRPSIIRTKKS